MKQQLESLGPGTSEVPRRVLFFGKRKSRSCCTGALVDALRHHGLEVRWINCSLIKRWVGSWGMKATVRFLRKRYRADLCFVFFHDLPHTLMAEFSREMPTVVWIEEPIRYIDSAQVDYVSSARLVCLSTPALVWAYRSLGVANSTFLMSGFSPRFHNPSSFAADEPRSYDRDLVYIGGPGHMGSRPEFLAWLANKYDLEIFGVRESWQPYLQRFPQLRLSGELRPSGYADVCARSKIVIGINQTHDSRLYFSNRVFLTLACKGFHLMRYVPGMEEVFEDGKHLMWFHEREDCEAHIERMLADDAARERIAEAGHRLVVGQHRYHDRVAAILDILSGRRELDCPLEGVDDVLEIGTDARNAPAAILYPRRPSPDFLELDPERVTLRNARPAGRTGT
ncbi:MAG: glycosyltransferase [Planctomycetes bacterium]|nr:glycosyltransferase [Planctomycetota bacterium]